MKTFPICLTPGQDLRAALEAAVLAQKWQFTREPDAGTGYDELVIRAQG